MNMSNIAHIVYMLWSSDRYNPTEFSSNSKDMGKVFKSLIPFKLPAAYSVSFPTSDAKVMIKRPPVQELYLTKAETNGRARGQDKYSSRPIKNTRGNPHPNEKSKAYRGGI